MINDGEFQITKRELVFSIAIIAVMLLIGFVIHGNINDALMLKYQEYNTALQIENNQEMFVYGMETNIGNSFIYGDLKAVDTVSYPELNENYSYIRKVKERYTKHTRWVTKTKTVNGETKTYREKEEYWTWDEIYSWNQHCNKITFLNVEFDYGVIDFPYVNYITTIKESSRIRYVYYGTGTEYNGTLYAILKDNTISDTHFYNNSNIKETIKSLESGAELIIFWVVWIPLIVLAVFGFYLIDNKWLEDKNNKNNYRKRY